MSYCEKCDKTFSSRQSLWKHRQRKHQGQTDTIRSIVNKAVQGADKDTTSMMTVTPVKSPPYLTKNPNGKATAKILEQYPKLPLRKS